MIENDGQAPGSRPGNPVRGPETTRSLMLGWLLAATTVAGLMWMLGPSRARGQDTAMVTIEAGPFTFGSDDGPLDERPAQVIELPAFEIERLPVTNAQYAEFLSAVGPVNAQGRELFDVDDPDARLHLAGDRYLPDAGFEWYPVVEATWAGARDYCAWRGARVPTEVEWERAARGRDGQLYPWGVEPPDDSRARFGAVTNDYLAVGSFPAGASAEGVLDLAGNVWQWVSSLYWPYPYLATDGREDPDDPGERVTRGGGHGSPAHQLRSAYRGLGLSRAPARGHHNIGLRCAR